MNQTTALLSHLSKELGLSNDKVADHLYHQLQTNLSQPATWYLIGTDGCHLCDESYTFLKNQQQRLDLPDIFFVDIVDLSNGQSNIFEKSLPSFIPILITPTSFLCYPFGVMDIINLKNTN